MTLSPPRSAGPDQPRAARSPRIGFLFNHDQIHQVAHSLPIAIALSTMEDGPDIVIATTNDAVWHEVERLLAAHGSRDRVRLVRLGHRNVMVRAAVRLLDWIVPAAKIAVYRDNLDFFRTLDALVVAEKTSAILKTRYGLSGLKLIHTRHGAGDRAVGFDRASAIFDLILVSGPKIRDRLMSEAGIAADRMVTTGYPKFDLIPAHPRPLRFANPGQPTVLYNPHVSPHLSSWYQDGRAVLDFFVDNPQYNLIFAPHVMLFQRRVVVTIDKLRLDRPGRLARRYRTAPNILIDLGSSASTDMSYTEAADVYLGDVSSQIYEFLRRPRPCLFLNSQHVDYRGDPNYAHWQAGVVLDDPADLGPALADALVNPRRTEAVQRALFEASISLDERPSSLRAARAILTFVGAAPTLA